MAVRRLALLAATMLAACQPVGPDYHLPQQALVNAPTAQGAFTGAAPALSTNTAPPGRWWQLYDNATLNRLIEEALTANTDLRVAEANLERSRALVAQAKAGREVGVNFNFDPAYGQLSAEQYLQPAIIAPTGLYDLGVSASYELDLFGRIRRGIEAANAEDEAVEDARDLARMAVMAQVAAAYVDLCGAGAQLQTLQRVLALQKERLGLLQKLVIAGRGTRLDITRAEGLIAQTQADIPSLEARRRNALFLLATLAGKPPAAFDAKLETCDVIPALARPIPVGDGAALLKRRPMCVGPSANWLPPLRASASSPPIFIHASHWAAVWARPACSPTFLIR